MADENKGTSADGTDGLQSAGDVALEVILIDPSGGNSLNIRQFVGEVSIFEDIFKPGLSGNILIIDATNLTQNFPITGEEFIRIRIRTPSMEQEIDKTFKIYSITNRLVLRDTNTQSYVMHFISPEVYMDLLAPVYGTFKGKISDVVQKIYETYMSSESSGENQIRPLVSFDTENEVEFTSPGWTASHCINWLANKAIGEGYKNPGYLFYESSKAFYFANVEAIFDSAIKNKAYYQDYIYMANNITKDGGSGDGQANDSPYAKDVEKEFKKVEDFEVVETYNTFKNVQNGYYANRLITLDLMTKKYETFDYDHVASYKDYKHLENIAGNEDCNPASPSTLRTPASYIQFYPKNQSLYDDYKDNNVDYLIENTLPRRVSTINELNNFRLVITVPGRADAEVGSVVYFSYPDTSPSDESDKNKNKEDDYYSGFYFVTAIRHKLTLQKHMMIMEIAKESSHKKVQ